MMRASDADILIFGGDINTVPDPDVNQVTGNLFLDIFSAKCI
jgi:hypothetical protein